MGLAIATAAEARAQTTAQSSDSADLAKKLSKPVADLISVPFQFNYNGGFHDGDGNWYYLNIQPVIPLSISRTG